MKVALLVVTYLLIGCLFVQRLQIHDAAVCGGLRVAAVVVAQPRRGSLAGLRALQQRQALLNKSRL